MSKAILTAASAAIFLFLNGCASGSNETTLETALAGQSPADAEFREATGEGFAQQMLDAEQPVVVQFHASWCSHCRALERDLRALTAAHAGGVQLVSVDIDAEEELAESHGVERVPTLQVYVRGTRLGEVVGVRDRAVLELLFESLSSSDFARAEQVLRRLGPARPGSACAARLPREGDDGATCTTPSS